MRALTVRPGQTGSVAVTDMLEPASHAGAVLVETLAVGICGTDNEIVMGEYGEAPPGEDRLVLTPTGRLLADLAVRELLG